MSESSPLIFVAHVNADLGAADERVRKDGSPLHRREFVRAALTASETMCWLLRRGVAQYAKDALGVDALRALLQAERSVSIDAQGEIDDARAQVPLKETLSVALKIAEAYLPNVSAVSIKRSRGYDSFLKAIDVRNRVTHPKSNSDIEVTAAEVQGCRDAYFWLIDVLADVMKQSQDRFGFPPGGASDRQ